MKVYRAHLDVVCCVVMLGVVVCKVGVSRGPFNGELPLVNSVWDPVETHVHSLGPLEFVVTVGKSTGSGIVGGDFGGTRLLMAKLLQDVSDENSFLAIVEEGAHFGLRGRSHNISHDAGLDVDGTIGSGEW